MLPPPGLIAVRQAHADSNRADRLLPAMNRQWRTASGRRDRSASGIARAAPGQSVFQRAASFTYTPAEKRHRVHCADDGQNRCTEQMQNKKYSTVTVPVSYKTV